MTRLQVEHLIQVALTIADDLDIVVIGSQAILAPAIFKKFFLEMH